MSFRTVERLDTGDMFQYNNNIYLCLFAGDHDNPRSTLICAEFNPITNEPDYVNLVKFKVDFWIEMYFIGNRNDLANIDKIIEIE